MRFWAEDFKSWAVTLIGSSKLFFSPQFSELVLFALGRILGLHIFETSTFGYRVEIKDKSLAERRVGNRLLQFGCTFFCIQVWNPSSINVRAAIPLQRGLGVNETTDVFSTKHLKILYRSSFWNYLIFNSYCLKDCSLVVYSFHNGIKTHLLRPEIIWILKSQNENRSPVRKFATMGAI